jgi:sugar lactone lactonase YvrE
METATMSSREPKQNRTTQAHPIADHRVDIKADGWVSGVAFDGEAIWYLDNAKHELVRIDADSGKELRRIPTKDGKGGTTFDGRYLWQVGQTRLFAVDPKSGADVREIEIPFEAKEHASGLAWRNGELWLGEHGNGRIHVIDAKSGKLVRSIEVGGFVTGVEWSGDQLWHGTHEYDAAKKDLPEDPKAELHRVDPSSGKLLERAKLPARADCSGLAADGKGRLFYGDSNLPGVRVVRVD